MGNCNEEFNFVCIPPSETTESLPALQIEVQVGDQKAKHIPPTQNVRNVTAGQLNAQNLNASYSTYDERAGTTTDARGNKYYKYVEAGMLYGTVKGPISLTVTTRWLSSEESIAIFKSIQVNEIHGYSQKYWLNAGNQFLSNSSYIDAIAAYDEVENMQVKTVPLSHEVIDKKGIALYMLGRYNETIDWYSSARPKSSEAWYSYGMALKAMHLESQAEYAFDQTKK